MRHLLSVFVRDEGVLRPINGRFAFAEEVLEAIRRDDDGYGVLGVVFSYCGKEPVVAAAWFVYDEGLVVRTSKVPFRHHLSIFVDGYRVKHDENGWNIALGDAMVVFGVTWVTHDGELQKIDGTPVHLSRLETVLDCDGDTCVSRSADVLRISTSAGFRDVGVDATTAWIAPDSRVVILVDDELTIYEDLEAIESHRFASPIYEHTSRYVLCLDGSIWAISDKVLRVDQIAPISGRRCPKPTERYSY